MTPRATSTTPGPPILGRFTELTLAKSLLREGKQGRPSLLMVGGEDGVGKTRLVQEIAREARGMGFTIAEARLRRDDPSPLGGTSQILMALLAALGEARLREALHGLPGSLGGFLPVLAPYREPRASDPGALPDPEAERLRLFEATRVLLTRLVQTQPTLWIVDDIQNARDGELKLMAFLSRTLTAYGATSGDPLPLLAVATHRLPPGEGVFGKLLASAGTGGFPFETIRLPPLSERDAFELARALVPAFPESLREDLHRRTGGNPFFVVEALKAARIRGGKIRTLPDLPPGVMGLVRARVARFDERARTVCFAAAALGERFDLDLLRSVVGMPLGELLSTVGQLVEENLLERDHVDRTFRFTHSFVKEAIYESSPSGARVKAHRSAAKALESQSEDSGRFARLAFHYERSGDREREIRSLLRAGDEALARFDGRDALAAYDRLLAAYGELDGVGKAALRDLQLKALSGVVRSARALGETDRAVTSARELLGVAKKEKDPAVIVPALRDLATSLVDANEASQALLQIDLAIRAAKEAGLPDEHARAMAIKSAISQKLGDPSTRDLVDQAVELASHTGDAELLGECLVRQAICRYEGGDDRAAEESYTRALRMAKAKRQPRIAALAHTTRGAVLAQGGHFDEALRDFSAALATNRRIGDVRSTGHSLVNLASIHAFRGRVDRALVLHREAIVILKGLGFRGDLAFSLFSIGNIELDRRRYRQALDAYEEALVIRKELGERNRIAELMNNMGVAHFEMGEYQKARELLEVSVALCLEMGYLVLGVESNAYLGACTAAKGEPEAGLDAIRRAIEDARIHDLKAQAATGRYLMGFVLAGQGRGEEGVAEIRGAIEEARAMGLAPLMERFDRTLRDVQEGRTALRSSQNPSEVTGSDPVRPEGARKGR